MKLLIEIPDNKTLAFMEVINELSYLKVTQISNHESNMELMSWQKDILDERANDYFKNPFEVVDFNQTLLNIKNNI